uniref:CSON008555 protein n=1 Tax=Culicoides sonorensis TaxID=179676 RepID=A0A336KEK5_CULSO
MNIKLVVPYAYFICALLIGLIETPERAIAQQPLFELPVQLIGFPVIVLAVRISTFVKRLAYSLNPQTYTARNRRSPDATQSSFSIQAIDASLAEKRIITEMGPKACVMEEPCRLHATNQRKYKEQPDWVDILRNYKTQSTGTKQWYLLSVFLGDVIRDVQLCKQLAKRLPCGQDDIKLLSGETFSRYQ